MEQKEKKKKRKKIHGALCLLPVYFFIWIPQLTKSLLKACMVDGIKEVMVFVTTQTLCEWVGIVVFGVNFLTSTTLLATCSHTKRYARAILFLFNVLPGLVEFRITAILSTRILVGLVTFTPIDRR